MPGEGGYKANVKQISALLKLIAFFIYNEAKTGKARQKAATTGKMTQSSNNAAITGFYMRRRNSAGTGRPGARLDRCSPS